MNEIFFFFTITGEREKGRARERWEKAHHRFAYLLRLLLAGSATCRLQNEIKYLRVRRNIKWTQLDINVFNDMIYAQHCINKLYCVSKKKNKYVSNKRTRKTNSAKDMEQTQANNRSTLNNHKMIFSSFWLKNHISP